MDRRRIAGADAHHDPRGTGSPKPEGNATVILDARTELQRQGIGGARHEVFAGQSRSKDRAREPPGFDLNSRLDCRYTQKPFADLPRPVQPRVPWGLPSPMRHPMAGRMTVIQATKTNGVSSLYDETQPRDNCGFGLIAQMDPE